MEEKVYALTETPVIEGSYTHGPTPDLESLIGVRPGEGIAAEIHLLTVDKPPIILYRWSDTEWIMDEDMAYLADFEGLLAQVGTKIGKIKAICHPDPFTPGPGKKLVMDELGITGHDNEMLMVSGKVLQINVESKAKAGEYQNDTRAYVPIAPDNLHVHILVQDPARYVDESGDLDLLAHVLGRIARTVDMEVVSVANLRLDQNIVARDLEKKPKRATVRPRKEVPTEVL